MKVYKIVLTVVDFDDIGQESVRKEIECARYPNDCISPSVMSIESRDIGEWSDDHPLNKASTAENEMRRLFLEKK